ncbi:hypothetical protein [Niveispirillum cyanobacteriorum]|uniref:Uncharacterized protein n=1 Tax=Niveispirillum cyanobacteriorum TaxID=1612173 RepID=A0A2K9N8B9_9PROT|nr:hypothetical protein [Niveispirillum cyanobacteriorum]AUN29232.1 hypothetical protein C0V82_02430 [Niveispirillum cyanobacteriorum]GGE66199.1 hypothetical protein GCM10011317_24390 [Niveispirillum cyanobacteriorum]
MELNRIGCIAYFVILGIVTSLNYIPGLTDAEGRTFGIFALDIYDDALHGASALWAGLSALNARSARFYMRTFGALYLSDGLLGLIVGVGYLDVAIFTLGPQDMPLLFKFLANLPHIALGSIALFLGWRRQVA